MVDVYYNFAYNYNDYNKKICKIEGEKKSYIK